MSNKKSRKNYNMLFDTVKTELDGFDVYGLLELGAPHDEFISEAVEICGKLKEDMSVSEIAQVIAEVYNKNFEEVFQPLQFIADDEKIKQKL